MLKIQTTMMAVYLTEMGKEKTHSIMRKKNQNLPLQILQKSTAEIRWAEVGPLSSRKVVAEWERLVKN